MNTCRSRDKQVKNELAFVCPEPSRTSLSNDICPVNDDVDPNLYNIINLIGMTSGIYSPSTRGGKFGL
jgi:hypothetical protein